MIIYWHKHDFRLFDNQALNTARELSKLNKTFFVPILGLEMDLAKNPKTAYEYSLFHQFGYYSSILPLYQNYLHYGLNPILFTNSALDLLEKIFQIKKITHLVSHQEHGTSGTWERDKEVAKFCKANNIQWIEIPPSSVKRGVLNRDNRDKIFKNYVNTPTLQVPKFEIDTWKETEIQPLLEAFKVSNLKIFTQFSKNQLEIQNNFSLSLTSEKEGLQTFQSFTKIRSKFYRGGISSPNSAIIHGSRLSQFLAFGSLSLRFVYQYFWKEIKLNSNSKIRSGILGALQRLHWREHFIQRLETEAGMANTAINKNFNAINYSHNLDLFEKFKTGNTGEVLIDACIRCLLKTGFINFRMRAMLVSYAVFGLDLNWREVGRFLASVFLDYEPGIHWSQVQMQSGVTGINTIRVYSPHKQLLDQDPECVFVKKWLPQLASIDNDLIKKYPTISLFQETKGAYPDPACNFKEASKINKLKTFGVRKKSDPAVSKQVYLKHGSRRKKPKVIKTSSQLLI